MQDWYPTRYVKGIFGSVEVFHLKEISSSPRQCSAAQQGTAVLKASEL